MVSAGEPLNPEVIEQVRQSWGLTGWEPDRETALAILRHARDKLPPYQRVRRLEFFELPKTVSGKIRRVELRGREEKAASDRSSLPEWRDDQFPELRS